VVAVCALAVADEANVEDAVCHGVLPLTKLPLQGLRYTSLGNQMMAYGNVYLFFSLDSGMSGNL
jgi:hypothetical protein